MALYEPLHEGFTRYCSSRSYGVMETEDLVQETVLVAFDKFEALKDPKAFLAYLMRIASNIVATKARRLKFRGYYDEESFRKLQSMAPSPEVATDVDYLYKALRNLSDQTRQAIELFEIAGFSIKEIAEIQESSESAVKVRLHRGRKQLKEELAPVGGLEKAMVAVALLLGIGSI